MGEKRIHLKEVGKKYKLYRRPEHRLVEWVSLGRKLLHETFWALRDVSFDIGEGEALGIIGENGAGKSTLLKIISGTAFPTTGRAEVNGRVTALLELGTGFHPEFSGRENLVMNARLLGLTEEEIRARMEEVIEFAELGDFLDQPVRTFSSGMQLRLGFAVAASVNPDVMVVDEALAIGDAYFQKKSLDRVKQFRDQGLTFLFVTHDLALVKRFCSRCLWMKNGRMEALGETQRVVRDYQLYSQEKQRLRLGSVQGDLAVETAVDPAGKHAPKSRWGNQRLRITRAEMLGPDRKPRWTFEVGEEVTIRLHYQTDETLKNPVFSFQIERLDGIYVMGTSNADNNIDHRRLGPLRGSGVIEYQIEGLSLHGGTYFLSVQAFPEPDEPFWSDPGDCHFQMYEFKVWSSHRQHGVVALPGSWRKAKEAVHQG